MEPQNSTSPEKDDQKQGIPPAGSGLETSTEPVETESAPTPRSTEIAQPTLSSPAEAASSEPANGIPPAPVEDTDVSDSTSAPALPAALTEPTPVDAIPAVAGAVVGGANQSPTQVGSPHAPHGGKRQMIMAAIIAVVVVGLAAAYAFFVYMPNRPSEMYAKSLTNTGDALDALVSYSNSVASKNYKSYNVSSTLHDDSTESFDATLSGAVDTQGDSKLVASADVLGAKMNANIESVHVAGSTTPDVYVQLNGIKPTLNTLGLSNFDSLDGEWIGIDHTLINSYAAQLNQNASAATKGSVLPTAAELHDAETQVQTVNKEYLFTNDPSKAVLANQKFINSAVENGLPSYHYVVGYNKTHLEAYVTALGTALDSSTLNTWAKEAYNGESLSQVLNIASLQKSVKNASGNETFDVWVDTKTRLIDSVQFADPSDKTSIFTVSQGYTGGSSYPFSMSFDSNDGASSDSVKTAIDLTLNKVTNAYTGTLSTDEGSTNVVFDFTLTPSSSTVKVSAPSNAEPVANVLGALELGADSSSL